MKTSKYLVATCVSIVLFLTACDKAPDEEQIAQNISAMEEAVERKAFTEIQEHLHNDFIANERMSTSEVKQLLNMYSMQHKYLGVSVIASKTTMDPTFPDRAETTMSVVLTGSSGRLPSDGSMRTVKLAWVKQSGDWLVRKADWQH